MLKKSFIVPALLGAAAAYLYLKSRTPTAPAIATVPVAPAAPATMAGFGFRR